MIPKHAYWGTDVVAGIMNVKPNEHYSLVDKIFVRDGINYYVINDFYLASGTVIVEYGEDGTILSEPIYVSQIEDKIYQLDSYVEVEYALVEVTLSTGEVLEYEFTGEEIGNLPTIDLTNYTYDSVAIKITTSCNPYSGTMMEMILETGLVTEGMQYITIETIYNY